MANLEAFILSPEQFASNLMPDQVKEVLAKAVQVLGEAHSRGENSLKLCDNIKVVRDFYEKLLPLRQECVDKFRA